MDNIGLQDSLLSRFDLLFVMLDVVDSDQDHIISDFVVRMHRYRNPKEQDGDVLPMGSNFADMLSTFRMDSENSVRRLVVAGLLRWIPFKFPSFQNKPTPVYEKYDELLHGTSRKKTDQILSIDFMRKYIHIAKILKPKLSEQACEAISNEYSRLRSQDMTESDVARTQPVTARTLETLIRLATAHAKARMAKTVSVDDAHAAIELVQFAYFKKVLEKEKRKRHRSVGSSDDDNDDEDVEERGKRTRLEDVREEDDTEEPMIDEQHTDAGDLTRRATISAVVVPSTSAEQSSEEPMTIEATITDGRLKVFQHRVQAAFRQQREQSIPLVQLVKVINTEASGGGAVEEPFDSGEVQAAIARMTDANKIMLADDIVFLIWMYCFKNFLQTFVFFFLYVSR